MKKFVVLEHLLEPYRGCKFWSTNGPKAGFLDDGREAYKVILETDSAEEAKRACGYYPEAVWQSQRNKTQ